MRPIDVLGDCSLTGRPSLISSSAQYKPQNYNQPPLKFVQSRTARQQNFVAVLPVGEDEPPVIGRLRSQRWWTPMPAKAWVHMASSRGTVVVGTAAYER